MKIFLLSVLTIIFISGCATKNAFSKLKMDVDQEKAIENTRSAKMLSEGKVGGIFSAIYLNNIYTDKTTQQFYISIFMKESKSNLDFTLNGNKPLEIKELASDSEFAHLLMMENKWTKNYLISFENTKASNLNLLIYSDQFSSGQLKYLKD